MSDPQIETETPLPGIKTIALAAGLSVLLFLIVLRFASPIASGFTALLFFAMALITVTDLRHFIIPDVLSLPAIPVGVLANVLVTHDGDWQAGLIDGIAGAVIGGGVFLGLRLIYGRVRGVEGLGLGDVKLAAVAGAWLGPSLLAPACLAATLAAIAAVLLQAILRPEKRIDTRAHIPFGSFIAPTIFVFWTCTILVTFAT